MKQDIEKVAIVGAGTMGRGIAQCFAQGGYKVSLFSRTQKTLDRALPLIESSLNTMVEEGMLDQSLIKATIERITPTTSLQEAADDADIAIESVTENRDLKKAIFAQLDMYCPPRALLASNTTSLNIFDFVETSRPDKVLCAHWYTPPQLIPLVDVVKGPETSEASVELMTQTLKRMGKKPVVFQKPVPGYVVPRLQIALQREVYFLLDNGYLSPKELDEAAKWGLAFRMMVLGVVQRIDFGGLDLSAINVEKPSFEPTPVDYKPKKLLELVKQGHLGVKTGRGFYDYQGRSEADLCRERDIRLIRLLKAIEGEAGS